MPQKRWQERLENILTTVGFCVKSNQLDPRLWTRAGQQTALAYHVDGLLIIGARQTIQEVHPELSTDLEIVANEVMNKRLR